LNASPLRGGEVIRNRIAKAAMGKYVARIPAVDALSDAYARWSREARG